MCLSAPVEIRGNLLESVFSTWIPGVEPQLSGLALLPREPSPSEGQGDDSVVRALCRQACQPDSSPRTHVVRMKELTTDMPRHVHVCRTHTSHPKIGKGKTNF